MGRRHGRRPHVVRDCGCTAKSTCYTTWDAAQSAVTTTPDAIRSYRGTCCGHYHITKYTIDEFAQRVASFCVQDEADYDTVVSTTTAEEGNHEDHEQAAQGVGLERGEPGTSGSGSGEAGEQRRTASRFPPSPAALARCIAARRNQGR